MSEAAIPRCEPSIEFRNLPFHWVQWRTPFRHDDPEPWRWDTADEWVTPNGQHYSPERAAQLQYHYIAPARAELEAMPVSGDDFDQNPEIFKAALLQFTEVVTARLRELAQIAAMTPHVTAERALCDAATMIEKAMTNTLTRMGSDNNTSHH